MSGLSPDLASTQHQREGSTDGRSQEPTRGGAYWAQGREVAGAPEFRTDRFMIDGPDTAGRLSVVEHTLAPTSS